MNFRKDCVVCGSELNYRESSVPMLCVYCGESFESQVACRNGHYVCDTCHSLPASDFIAHYCVHTDLRDPLEMAVHLMRDSRIKMHGPEHHFLVPAVLTASYYYTIGDPCAKAAKIRQAQTRAKNVLGGFCGYYGACGAGVGTGIFISLVTGANPLSKNEWQLANLMTARSLNTIARLGGPRCCKRDTFLALLEAINFTREKLNVTLPCKGDFACEFSALNRECLGRDCPFNPA